MSLTGDTVMVNLWSPPRPLSLTLFKQAWRCYVVYGRSRIVVIFPTVLILASISEIMFIIYSQSNHTCFSVCVGFIISQVASAPTGQTIFATATPWLTTFFVLTLCTNSYSTSEFEVNNLGRCYPNKDVQVLLCIGFGAAYGLLDPATQAVAVLCRWSWHSLRVEPFMPLPGSRYS